MKFTAAIFSLLFMFNICSYTLTNESQDPGGRDQESGCFYIGTNPISYAVGLQLKDNLKRYMPLISGLEYGFSLIGGFYPTPKQSVEARFSIGNIHQVASVAQFHLGINFFISGDSKKWYSNFYSGVFFKFWDYHNRLTEIHFYNIAPYIPIGCQLKFDSVILDFRINQAIAVYSWSNLEHSSGGIDWFFSPWPEFIPVLPSLTFSIDYKIQPKIYP